MKKKLHTTKIVAQYLDLSERRVRQLRDEGVLEEKAPGLYLSLIHISEPTRPY